MTDARRPPILVVDDNHDNAEIIRQYLEAHGYPIFVAYDGDEALTQFETVRPSLVLLDVSMPGMSGIELAEALTTVLPGVPVVLTTGYSDEILSGAGAEFEVLRKPYDTLSLGKAIVAATGDIYYGLWYPVGVAAMTFVVGLIFLPDRYGRELLHD